MANTRSISSVTSEIFFLQKRVFKGEATSDDKARLLRLRESLQSYRHSVNCCIAALRATKNPEVQIALAQSIIQLAERSVQAPVLIEEVHPFWGRINRAVYTGLIRPLSKFLCAFGLKWASLNPQEE